MEKKAFIESRAYAIYHELGHLYGYCLSNRFQEFKLGDVEIFNLGQYDCSVHAAEKLFHFDNIRTSDEIYNKIIRENTKNIKTTIAWFIEVIAGCTFEAIYSQDKFNSCFDYFGHGQTDFFNILRVKENSYFKYTEQDIKSIQHEFENIVIKHKLIDTLEPIVIKLKEELFQSEEIQITLYKKQIQKYMDLLDGHFTFELLAEYESLVNKFSEKFSAQLRE